MGIIDTIKNELTKRDLLGAIQSSNVSPVIPDLTNDSTDLLTGNANKIENNKLNTKNAKVKDSLISQFVNGYNENRNESFSPENLSQINQLINAKKLLNPDYFVTNLGDNEKAFNTWATNNKVNITPDYDMRGYWNEYVRPYDALRAKGYDENRIARIQQGLNGGNIDDARTIQELGIRKPTEEHEIDAARNGNFNEKGYDPNTQHYTDKYKTPLHESFSTGSIYADPNWKDPNGNSYNELAGSWDKNTFVLPEIASKSPVNRIGEALGTATRVLSNPALQGIIAGSLYGYDRGDALYGLGKGFEWATNKAKSDNYARAIGMQPGILGSYGNEDLNAHTMAEYRKIQNYINNYKAQKYGENIDNQITNRDENTKINQGKLDESKRHNKETESIGRTNAAAHTKSAQASMISAKASAKKAAALVQSAEDKMNFENMCSEYMNNKIILEGLEKDLKNMKNGKGIFNTKIGENVQAQEAYQKALKSIDDRKKQLLKVEQNLKVLYPTAYADFMKSMSGDKKFNALGTTIKIYNDVNDGRIYKDYHADPGQYNDVE